MATLSVEQPPHDLSPLVKDYLTRQWVKIDIALRKDNYFPPRSSVPAKTQVGEMYYFKSAILGTDITGEGLWLVKSTGWVLVA